MSIEARIQGETQIRSELEIDAASDERAQFLLVEIESLNRHSSTFAAKRHHENRRQFEIRRHAHRTDGQRMTIQGLINHLAARENVRDRVTDQFADALDPVTRGVGFG